MSIPMKSVSAMNEKERVALGSIGASAALTIGKALVRFATGSLAILSEAAHSLIDLAATLMTYFAVRIADKPADREHHYGHGKVESVSALAKPSRKSLEADALHFSSDMWSSAAVLRGLVGVRLGHAWADSAAAVVVALVVCLAGWR